MAAGGGRSHCLCSQEAEREQEMELSYGASSPPSVTISSSKLARPSKQHPSWGTQDSNVWACRLAIPNLPDSATLECSPSCCGDHNYKVISWLPHNCHFATVMNHDVDICGFGWYWVTPVKGSFDPKGLVTQVENGYYRRNIVHLNHYTTLQKPVTGNRAQRRDPAAKW